MAFKLDELAYEGLLRNPNITEEVIDTLLSRSPNKWILKAIACSEKATVTQLEVVYKKSKSYEVLESLASNPKTPDHILKSLFRNKDHKRSILGNQQIPKKLISSFLKTKGLNPYWVALASNPALSDKNDQFVLAKRMLGGEGTAEHLFSNPNLHLEVFEYLCSSGITGGRFIVRCKYFSEKHAKVILNSDDDGGLIEWAKYDVLSTTFCPKDIVLKARKDGSERERVAAFSNMSVPIDYANIDYMDLPFILGLIQRDDLPKELLIKIARLEAPPADSKAANKWYSEIKHDLSRKHLPLSVLEILFSQGVVASSNPSLSEEMLEHCITKGSELDKMFALKNPQISLAKIKSYLGLEEKQSGVSKAKPFYDLPDWYKQVTNSVDQLPCSELGLDKSPVPRVFIPNLADAFDSSDEILGVIGGYFYKSDQGDQRIRQGFAQPVVQINLDMISRATGTYFGDKILQVWGHDDDWGQGGIATCDTVDIKDVTTSSDGSFFKVDEPSSLINASQYDKATACFDWTDSTYANDLGLRAPIFIVGVEDAGLNVQLFNKQQKKFFSEMMKTLNFDAKEYEEFFSDEPSYIKDEVFKEGTAVLNGIMHIQKFRLNTSFGNFNEENLMRSGSWLPLFTLCGPLDDPIEDFYTIFYSKTKEGDYKYKAKAHRWCY
jgi:hypothetical protein